MSIHLFAVCKGDRFAYLMEHFFKKENIFIAGVCRKPMEALNQFRDLNPTPDIILLDAYWPNSNGKKLLSQFSETDAKVILVTNYYDPKVLNDFSPRQAHGYIFRNCDDHTMITDCIRQVYSGVNCYNAP